jgi:hypothetical protein
MKTTVDSGLVSSISAVWHKEPPSLYGGFLHPDLKGSNIYITMTRCTVTVLILEKPGAWMLSAAACSRKQASGGLTGGNFPQRARDHIARPVRPGTEPGMGTATATGATTNPAAGFFRAIAVVNAAAVAT